MATNRRVTHPAVMVVTHKKTAAMSHNDVMMFTSVGIQVAPIQHISSGQNLVRQDASFSRVGHLGQIPSSGYRFGYCFNVGPYQFCSDGPSQYFGHTKFCPIFIHPGKLICPLQNGLFQ